MLGILFFAALAGTIFPLTFFPEGYVVLGSCAILLVVRMFGTRWGLLVALLSGLCTFVVWQNPFLALIMLAEAAVVGMLIRRGMENLVIADGIFWLFFGLPFLWIFYSVLLGADGGKVLQVLVRYGLNGHGNALLAALIHRFLLGPYYECRSPPLLREAHFNVIVSAFLLPAVLIVLMNTTGFRDARVPGRGAELTDEAAPVYDKLAELGDAIRDGLTEIARAAPNPKGLSVESLRRKTEVLRRANPLLRQVFVADSEGRVIAFATGGSDASPAALRIEEKDLEELRYRLRPVISAVRSGGPLRGPHICWYFPVIEEDRLAGVAGGIIDAATIRHLLDQRVGDESLVFTLVDHRGKVIASSSDRHKPLDEFYRSRYDIDHFFTSRGFLWQPVRQELDNIPFWAGFLPPRLPPDHSLPWRLAVEVPQEKHLLHLQRAVGRTLAIMLLPALLAMGILPLTTRRMTAPLKKLADLTGNLPEKILNGENIRWPDHPCAEVGSLVDNFQALINALEKSYRESENLRESSEEALDRVLTEKRWEVFSASRQLQQEIGKRRRIEELLEHIEAAETKYRFLVEKTLVGVYIVQDDYFSYVNPRFAEIFGYSAEEILRGCTVLDLIDQEDKAYVAGNLRRQLSGEEANLQYEFRGRRKNGSLVHVEALNGLGTYNGRNAILGTLIDISERKRAEETVFHMAYHDPLTGLPNRLLFNDRADQAMAMARRNNEVLALLFIDLDRFKAINDTLGHDIGDRLLKEAAGRLEECVRDSDTVSRFGGDEFNLLLTQVRNESDAELVAHKILRAMRWPFHIEGHELHGTASIGMALFPRDGRDVQTLIKNADTALYRAKDLGRNNYQVFHTSMNAQALERMELENSLHKVLDRRELRVYYQAQVSLHSARVIGMEALLRWQHPSGGMISPATFIPLAEETGLIFPIGEWMMRAACRQAMEWQRSGFEPLRLGINVSAQQFQDREFMSVLSRILEDFEFSPEWLNVEITESVVMQDVRENLLKLRQLHTVGVTVAIDDFGVGYSSLSYLKDFPVDQLKMDRSFVQNLPHSDNDAKIARHIVDMAHSLGLSVIAEGVENIEQLQFLKVIGCDEVQGYLLSRPVPAEDFELLLQQEFPFPFIGDQAGGTTPPAEVGIFSPADPSALPQENAEGKTSPP